MCGLYYGRRASFPTGTGGHRGGRLLTLQRVDFCLSRGRSSTKREEASQVCPEGFNSVSDRFTKDITFELQSTDRGLTKSSMPVIALKDVVLPSPGRSSEPRSVGVGSHGSSMEQDPLQPTQRAWCSSDRTCRSSVLKSLYRIHVLLDCQKY